MGSQKSTVLSSRATCLCAPTSHAGSFRCRLHRRTSGNSAAAIQPISRAPNSQSTEAFSDTKYDSRCTQEENSGQEDLRGKAVVQPASFEPATSKLSGVTMRKPSRPSKVHFADETSEDISAEQSSTVDPANANLTRDFIRKASSLSKLAFAVEDPEDT